MIAQLPLFELAHVTGGVQLSIDDVRPELVVVIPCSGEKAPGLRNEAGELFNRRRAVHRPVPPLRPPPRRADRRRPPC